MNVDRSIDSTQTRTVTAYNNNDANGGDAPPAAPNDNSGQNNSLDNMFMNLLVAQIQNQNPLNPMDGTQFVNQLAQLTQMQYTELMTQQLSLNNMMMDNLQVMATGNLVGQTVFVETDQLELNGQPMEGRLTLPHSANNVTLILKDEAGTEHKIDLGRHDKGQVEFTIDPNNPDLNLPEGKYSIKVVADGQEEGSSSQTIPVEVAGTINSVRLPKPGEQEGIKLFIPGIGEVPYSKIAQFGKPEGNPPKGNKPEVQI